MHELYANIVAQDGSLPAESADASDAKPKKPRARRRSIRRPIRLSPVIQPGHRYPLGLRWNLCGRPYQRSEMLTVMLEKATPATLPLGIAPRVRGGTRIHGFGGGSCRHSTPDDRCSHGKCARMNLNVGKRCQLDRFVLDVPSSSRVGQTSCHCRTLHAVVSQLR